MENMSTLTNGYGSNGFFEEDEPLDDVSDAFESGEKGLTGSCAGGQTIESASFRTFGLGNPLIEGTSSQERDLIRQA